MSKPRTIRLQHAGLEFSGLDIGKGPLVLCLHGFPDTEETFAEQFGPLSKAGYRVVAMRLRGYEPSSQPKVPAYHASELASDVVGWLDALKVERAHLVGHDWGATIAYAAAALAPARFHSLTTLAVPHPGRFEIEVGKNKAQLKASWYVIFFQIKGLSDWWLGRRNGAAIEKLWRAWSPQWSIPASALDAVKQAFTVRGVRAASLAYYRQALEKKSAAGAKSRELVTGPIPVPTLAMHGEADGCIRSDVFKSSMRQEEFPAGLTVKSVVGAGHFVHREKPNEVNELLVRWFGRNEKADKELGQ